MEPQIPAFYYSLRSIEDIIDHTGGKILDLLEIENSRSKRWEVVAAKTIAAKTIDKTKVSI